METRHPRLVIAATHSGCGKTSIALGLMGAFARQGIAVRPFKAGPDFIDPAFHARACGCSSYNLDPWLMPPGMLRGIFLRHALSLKRDGTDFSPGLPLPPGGGEERSLHVPPADLQGGRIFSAMPYDAPGQGELPPLSAQGCGQGNGSSAGLAIIEGVMGLFDGLGVSAEAGTAHLAEILASPVLLIVNAKGAALSVAATVSGFASFCPPPLARPCAVAGIILNRVSGEKHYSILRQCIEDHSGIPCFGYLADRAVPALPHRHLGLVPAAEQQGLDEHLRLLADAVERGMDLEGIHALALAAPPLPAQIAAAGAAERDEVIRAPSAAQRPGRTAAKAAPLPDRHFRHGACGGAEREAVGHATEAGLNSWLKGKKSPCSELESEERPSSEGGSTQRNSEERGGTQRNSAERGGTQRDSAEHGNTRRDSEEHVGTRRDGEEHVGTRRDGEEYGVGGSIKIRSGMRIGIALDEAFSFYYQDNLDFLRDCGVELEPFSPLRDRALPSGLSGIYLGGGFPELFAAELAGNEIFRSRLREA
ncbi:hypothetical protein LJC59_07515, partial [Desulfovibrio sp. OttesenSCG-928-A18]|nr:hypothetical protein [Desulfovibrio sp. OttesenSCG-928-A18]